MIKLNGKKIGCLHLENSIDFSQIKNKSQLLSIRNKDNKCILYCICAFFLPNIENPENPSSYEAFMKKLTVPDWINFPCSIQDLRQLSHVNSDLDFSFNLFKLSQGDIYKYI